MCLDVFSKLAAVTTPSFFSTALFDVIKDEKCGTTKSSLPKCDRYVLLTSPRRIWCLSFSIHASSSEESDVLVRIQHVLENRPYSRGQSTKESPLLNSDPFKTARDTRESLRLLRWSHLQSHPCSVRDQVVESLERHFADKVSRDTVRFRSRKSYCTCFLCFSRKTFNSTHLRLRQQRRAMCSPFLTSTACAVSLSSTREITLVTRRDPEERWARDMQSERITETSFF